MKTKLILAAACFLAMAAMLAAPGFSGPAKADHFGRAEALYSAGKTDAALKEYRAYLQANPAGPMAPAAWLKVAGIAAAQNDVKSARDAYQSVLSRWPDSLYSPDAKLGLVDCTLKEGRFQDALDAAKPLTSPPNSERVRAAAWVMTGDAQLSLSRPAQALMAYDQSLVVGRDSGRQALLPKVEKAVGMLNAQDLAQLLPSIQTCLPLGVLSAALAEKELASGDVAAAKDTAGRALSRCPNHERADRLRAVAASAQRSLGFNPSSFGVLLPLSGPYGSYGKSILAGVQLAVGHYNSLYPGRAVTIAIKDTGSTDEGARKGMAELAGLGVAAVVGPMTDADAIKKQARDFEIPAIVFTQRESLPEPGNFVFRNYMTFPMLSGALAAYSVKSLGLKRFAVLYPGDGYGATASRRFREAVVAAGGAVTCARAYDPKLTDFSEFIEKFLAATKEPAPKTAPGARPAQPARPGAPPAKPAPPKPTYSFDAVFIPDKPSTAGLVMSQLVYYGVRKPFIGTNAWHSGKISDVAGNAADGAVIADVFFRDSQSPAVREFVTYFSGANDGRPPGFLEALGYDSAMILFRAAGADGVKSGKALRKVLVGTTFAGVTGATSFDDSGEVAKDLVILRVTPDGFTEVGGPAFAP